MTCSPALHQAAGTRTPLEVQRRGERSTLGALTRKVLLSTKAASEPGRPLTGCVLGLGKNVRGTERQVMPSIDAGEHTPAPVLRLTSLAVGCVFASSSLNCCVNSAAR